MDKITWETIYRTQAPVLPGVCRRYISDPQTAEDIMHDAFLTAIHKQHTFTQKGPLIAWIRKITVNTAEVGMPVFKAHLLRARSYASPAIGDLLQITYGKLTVAALMSKPTA